MKIKKKDFLVALIIGFLSVAPYLKVFNGFFQQDEWLGYARFLLLKDSHLAGVVSYAFRPSVGHFTPLNLLTNHFLFSIWGMNYQAFLVLSILLHALVVALVYLFAREFFKQTKHALATALLFAVYASHYQGTAWVVANVGTQLATVFGILSVIFFLRHRIHVSLGLLTLALFFKEIVIGLFPVFLVYIFLFNKKGRSSKKQALAIVSVGTFYILARVLMLLGPNTTGAQVVTQSQSLTELAYNFATVPIKATSQTIVPIQMVHSLAEFVAKFFFKEIAGEFGSPVFESFVVKRVLEFISLLVSIVIVVLVLMKSNRSKIALLGLIWIVFNSFIFALAPERSGVISAIDSRNLYFVSIGAALMLVAVLMRIEKTSRIKAFILFFVIIVPNLYFLNQNLTVFLDRGRVRRTILDSITESVPNLPDKVVFYTQSDQSYYGLPPEERILPFQSGFGQTLLAWYYPTERFPKEFFEDRFLWEIREQGYKEFDGRGFGYFRDFGLLAKTVEENGLFPEAILAFSYNSDERYLKDITNQVRGRILGYLAEKREIANTVITFSASDNSADFSLAVDGKRHTYWDSGLSYSNPQYVQGILETGMTIAQVKIDSYNNLDQNKVGYRILLSMDGDNWKEVFNAEIYPPGEKGLVDLYFDPQKARFIRIEQLGFHKFASWVIHELTIYEVI